MSTSKFVARFKHAPDDIFALLIDAERHNHLIPFCAGASVTERRTAADGRHEVVMRHHILIERIAFATEILSTLRYHVQAHAIETVSAVGDGRLKSIGQVFSDGTGSRLDLQLDISGLPLRYRLLLIEPVLRRAHGRFIEKLACRAADVGVRRSA